MKSCDFCEREISDHVAVCPYSGTLQMSADQRREQTGRVFLVIILTLLLFVGFGLINISSMGSRRINDEIGPSGHQGSAAGLKKLTGLPSGSRNSIDRLPHGISVGCCNQSVTKASIRARSASTSST